MRLEMSSDLEAVYRGNNHNISRESRLFATKTARSIAEIQQSVNNMADVLVFLEVLGYDDKIAQKNGFDSIDNLAKYVYNFIDIFDDGHQDAAKSFEVPIPSTWHRLAESLSVLLPWLGSFLLLFMTGVSLWMAWGLPSDVTIAFVAGVFLGLVISEGLVQNFNRLFSFYYSQSNIGEVKRSIRRSYVLAAVILGGAITAIYIASISTNIPFYLATITVISTVTISLHRISYVIVYALKKLNHIAISYSIAFGTLLALFFLMPTSIISDTTLRYFVSLGSAFSVLGGFGIYHHYRIISQSSISIVAKGAPHFYNPLSINDNTIVSRFSVQLWECLPYSLYGALYFVLLFADRVISWIFNPVRVTATNGTVLPMSFNSIYHIGADLAMLVIFPAAILQFFIMSPIHALVYNRAVHLKIEENHKIDLFLRHTYRKMITISVAISLIMAITLNLLAPLMMSYVGGSLVSIRILGFASAGAVFLTIFAGNGLFLLFLNKAKTLAMISIAAALVVTICGVSIARATGFQNTVLAYVVATALAALLSTIAIAKTMENGSSQIFSRFV